MTDNRREIEGEKAERKGRNGGGGLGRSKEREE
jgi:hypothetical protein